MRIRAILFSLFTLAILLGLRQEAKASHAMGADIFYECVGQDSFLITMNFYRDCDGTSAPTSASVSITSDVCNQSLSLTLTRTTLIQPQGIPNGSEVSALCSQAINNSTCNNGNLPGVQQYQYQGLFVAPVGCPDWTIAYDLCCRNDIINTLQTPDSYDLYIETTLNNQGGICNNSPIFTNRPVPYFCYLDTIFYNHGTIDADGDSLVYTLIQPLDDPNITIPYAAGFSVTNPLTTNNTFSFSTTTGQMYFVPQQAQVGVITIRVDEYRNGVLVGSTMRDIQVIILGPPTCNPPYGVIDNDGIDSSSVSGGVFLDPYTIEACPGDSINFIIPMAGDSIFLYSNATSAVPGSTFDTTYYGPDSIVGEFTWIPTANDTGLNVFSIQFGINSCPIDRTSSQTVVINVLDGTYAGEDQVYCTEGDPIQLFATGGNSFTWSPAGSLNNPNVRNPLATPTVTTDYIVQSDLSARCKNRDTVRVEVVPNFLLAIQPTDDTIDICRNSLAQLEVVTDAQYGPYTYNWTPPATLNDSSISNPIASPILTTQYVAEVTSDTGCVLRDTITVAVTGVGPQVIASPDQTTICPGDTTQLDIDVYPVSCGPTIGLGSCGTNPPAPKTFGTGTTTSAVTPFTGANSDGRYQVLYRAADLRAAGVNAGTILRLSLNVGVKGSTPSGIYKNLSIKMGCTNQTQVTRNNWLPTTTEVFNSANFTTTTGAINFNLSQRYDWDGVSNLVVEFCYGDSSFTNAGGNDLLTSTIVLYPASMNAVSNTSNGGCNIAASQIPTNQPVFAVPNITFLICDAVTPSYTYTWSPATGLSDANIPNPTAVVNTPTSYTVTVSDTVCDGSDVVTIDLDTTDLGITNDTVLCNADSVQLQVLVNTLPVQCGSNGNNCAGPASQRTVGTGTVFNTNFDFPSPYANFFNSARQQYLYTAADLNAAGMTAGRITQMAFNIAVRLGATQYQNFTIRMGCTSATQLTEGLPIQNLTTVFGPQNVNIVSSGWNNHVFTNAYDWDGQSNLVVEVCFSNPTSSFSTSVFSTNTSYLSSTYAASDVAGNVCAGAQSTDIGSGFRRPNARFSVCPAPPPYTVSWSPSNSLTNGSIVNPVAFPNSTTTYVATVTTATGCIKQDSVTVSVGSLPYTISNDTSICLGASVNLNVTAGFDYTWTPAAGLSCTTCPNPTATPDSTTTYVVSIVDNNSGCSVIDSVTITVSNSGADPFPPQYTLCIFDSLQLDAGAGFDGYLWSNGDTTQTTWVFGPGEVYVTLTDANGCTASDTVTIIGSAAPQVDLGNDTSLCVGETLVLDAGGNYTTYNWSDGTQNSTITVTTGGEYSVTVTDANGCESTDTIEAFFNIVPVVNLGNDTLLCFRDTLRLSAGSAPGYNYIWSTGATDSVIFVDQSFPDTISVLVSGGATCFEVDTIVVEFQPEVVVSVGQDQPLCSGDTLTLFATPGFVSYQWNVPGATDDSLVVTTAGIYAVTVTNQIGCTGVDSVTIFDITPQVDLGADTTLCEGDTLILNATNQWASYSWSGGTQLTDSTVEVTTSGTYLVTVTDGLGCSGFDTINVQFAPYPVVDLGNDTTLCANETLVLDAGNAGATFLWSTSDQTQTISVTTDGSYSVTVTNAAGCATADTIEVEFLAPVIVDIGPDQTLCGGDTIVLYANDEFFQYDWTGGSNDDSLVVTTGGTYVLNVLDGFGCPGTDTVEITDVSPVINIPNQSICDGETATLDAGTWDSYNWSTGQQTQTITTDTAGTYALTVTDANGCEGYDTVTVTVNPTPTVALTAATDSICPGDNLVLTATGGYDDYIWSDTSGSGETLTITTGGTYSVTVVDDNNCTATTSITIGSYAGVSFTLADIDLCPGEADTIAGPAGYAGYLWSDGSTGQNLAVTDAGVYYLTATDDNGCTGIDSSVVSSVGVDLNAEAVPAEINVGETATVSVVVSNGSGNYSYSWTPDSTIVSGADSAEATVNPAADATYYITVTDLTTGCSATDSVTVVVFDETRYVFPKAFSPNGDGVNDLFQMLSVGDVELVEFRIYSRWGTLVHDIPAPWDGTYENTEQPMGTYVYKAVINITTAAGTTTETVQGGFTLVR